MVSLTFLLCIQHLRRPHFFHLRDMLIDMVQGNEIDGNIGFCLISVVIPCQWPSRQSVQG